MSERRLAYGLATLEPPSDDDALTFTASTTRLNRYGFRLRTEGWRLQNFNLNPVVLWHHLDFLPPIGRARASLADQRLKATVTFDRDDPFAASIEAKYRNKFLHAVSVGFDFVDSKGAPIRQWWSLSPEQIEKEAFYDLAEVSAVPVPADPGAVRQHHAALSAAGLELLDLAGGVGVDGWLRGTINPPTPGPGPGQLEPPQLPGNGTVERRLDQLEEELAQLGAARRVIPAHTTAVVDEAWDGDAARGQAPTDREALRYLHAWVNPSGDQDATSSYAFAHHTTNGGPANLPACRGALAQLEATDVPEGDHAGVERHLRRHLESTAEESWAPDAVQGFLTAIRL